MWVLRRWAVLAAICFGITLTYGCSSGGSDGDQPPPANNGDPGLPGDPGDPSDDIANSCDATITLSSAGGGLDSDAGADTLQFFAVGDAMCAFDPSSGSLATLDSGLATDGGAQGFAAVVPAADFSGDAASGMRVARVVYATDDSIRSLRVEGDAAALPVPEQVSSADNVAEIEELLVAPDYQNPDAAGLAFRRGSGATATWHATRVGAAASTDALDFASRSDVIAPLISPEDGASLGWLVRERTGTGAETQDTLRHVDLDLQPVGGDLRVDNPADIIARARLADGSVVMQRGCCGFDIYDPVSGTLNELADISDGDPRTQSGVFAASDTAMFILKRSFFGTSSEARVLRVDASGITGIDSAVAPGGSGIRTTFLAVSGDRVVWAWNSSATSGASSAVRTVGVDGNGAGTVATFDGTRDVTSDVIVGSNGAVYYNTVRPTGSLGWDAHIVDADGSGAAVIENHQWRGAAQGENVLLAASVLPPQAASEVFLVEVEPNFGSPQDQQLKVVDATGAVDAAPVDLGMLDDRQATPSVEMSAVGYGPHRLMRSGRDVIYADTRNADSARSLIRVDGSATIRLLDGF